MQETETRLAATIAAWCGGTPGTFPGSHPVSLMRADIARLRAPDPAMPFLRRYAVTAKPDGDRMQLLVCERGAFFYDRKVFPFSRTATALPPGTLLDGEWVRERDAAGAPTGGGVYLVFDALCVAGVNYMARPLWERLAAAAAVLPARARFGAGEAEVRLKQYYPLAALRTLVEATIPALPYACDGTVFVDMTAPYVRGRDPAQLKFKARDGHTVDMRVHRDAARFDEPGDAPVGADLMVLDGRRPVRYGRLADAAALTDGIIGEFQHVRGTPGTDAEWRFVRPRPDKSRPNDVATVAGVLRAAAEALTLDELCAALDAPDDAPDAACILN